MNGHNFRIAISRLVKNPITRGFSFVALLVSLVLGCAALYFIYRIGFPAPWTFDDKFSLSGLAEVSDFQSALSYVIGNNTGPTGRPVAMLSFLINVDDWNLNPAGFRQINTLIHLVNVALVASIAWLIARQVPALAARAAGFALVLALLWGAHPFLASSVLSAVQRMTLLSGFFVLLGLLGYLLGRRWAESNPRAGILTMLGAVAICTLLAGFSKENGFLLPSFIGLIEVLILARWRPLTRLDWQWVGHLLLWTPIVAFVLYVFWHWPGISGTQDYRRDFTWDQRLWSQALILLDYVRQTFIPDIRVLGPFQDDPDKLTGLTLWSGLAALFWIAALAAAIWKRKSQPLLLFGLSWFLIGHLVESSFIQLELYFEHRNYIPILGLLALPVAAAWQSAKRWPRGVLTLCYLPALLILLTLTVRGWGDPAIGTERWYNAHPESLRALIYKAQWVRYSQGADAAAELTLAAADHDSRNLEKLALALTMQCEIRRSRFGSALLAHTRRTLETEPEVRPSVKFLSDLEYVMDKRLKGQCQWPSLSELKQIYQFMLNQTRLPDADRTAKARLLLNLGLIDMAEGQTENGIKLLLEGFRNHRTYFSYGLIIETLLKLDRKTDAQKLTEEFIDYQPSNIINKADHRRRVMAAYDDANSRVLEVARERTSGSRTSGS